MSLISIHGITCSIPLELHHYSGMLIYICECVQVNIACAFRGVIASIGVSLLGVTHLLWENISGASIHWWTTLIRDREVEESRSVAGIVVFVKLWKDIVLAYACVCNRVCN